MKILKHIEILFFIFSTILSVKISKNIKTTKFKNSLNYKNKIRKNKSSFEIIRKELLIDNISFIELEEEKLKLDDMSSKNNYRKLINQELKNLGFISFYQSNLTKLQNVYKLIFSNLKKIRSDYIIYPYKFDYNKNSENYIVDNGGVFTLNQTRFTNQYEYIKDITSVNISFAQALYDINIAVISFEKDKTELFSESKKYCDFYKNLGKTCTSGLSNFEKNINNYKTKGTMILVNLQDLNRYSIVKTGTNQFDLLIIPDYLPEYELIIKEQLTDNIKNQISIFINNGGHILASGLSGYLLEILGIIESGTYSTDKFLFSTNNIVNLKGCESTINKNPNDEDNNFIHQFLCLGIQQKSFLNNSYLMNNILEFETLLYIDKRNENLKYLTLDKTEEIDINVNEIDNDFPFILVKNGVKNGKIWIINGQALNNFNYASIIVNIIFYSMSKNIIYDFYIDYKGLKNENNLVPGNEEGIITNVHYNTYNFFTTTISNLEIDLFLPYGVEFKTIPSECIIEREYPKEINSMNTNEYLKCSKEIMNQFENLEIIFKIEILNKNLTNKWKSFSILYTTIKYYDDFNEKEIEYNTGEIIYSPSPATVLRAQYYTNPTSNYQISGKGVFLDNFLNIEHKNGSDTQNVNFITIIPLISPLLDNFDSQKIVNKIEIYNNYYINHNYKFPFNEKDIDYDYIDYAELSGKNIINVIDWDTPVKISKVMRSDINSDENHNIYSPTNRIPVEQIDIIGSDIIKKTNSDMLLKEVYHDDNLDLIDEQYNQRELIFIDTSKERGANIQYNGDLSKCKTGKDERRNACKYDFIWMRNDFFFYDNSKYLNPKGIKKKIILTIDKYPNDNDLINSESSIIKQGIFDSNEDEKLIPNEYKNILLDNTEFELYNLSNNDGLEKLEHNFKGTVKLTHYIIPVNDEN